MAASASRNGNEAIGALFNRLACEPVIDDVMQRNPAPTVDGFVQFFLRAKRCDGNRDLPFGTNSNILLQPVI